MRFPHTATVRRQAKVGTKYTYADASTTPCFLQQLDADKAQIYGMTFGKSYVCYLPIGADVVDSDRIVISGITYGVMGIKSEPYGGLQHKKAMVELS